MGALSRLVLVGLLFSLFVSCEVSNSDDAPSFVPVLVITPTSVTFDDTLFGRSRTATFTIQNLSAVGGTVDMAVGLNAPFAIVSPTFPLTIGPTATLTITVSFTPTSIGVFKDSLLLTTDDPQRPQVGILFSGNGVDVTKTEVVMPAGNLLLAGSRITVIDAARAVVSSPGVNGIFGDGDDVLVLIRDTSGTLSTETLATPGLSTSQPVAVAGTTVTVLDTSSGLLNRFDLSTTPATQPPAPPAVAAVSTGVGSSPLDMGGGNIVLLDTAGTLNVARFASVTLDTEPTVYSFDLTTAASQPAAMDSVRTVFVDRGVDTIYGTADDDVVVVRFTAGGGFPATPVHSLKTVDGTLLFTLSPTFSRPLPIASSTVAFYATADPAGVAGDFVVKAFISVFGAAQSTPPALDLGAAGVGTPLGPFTEISTTLIAGVTTKTYVVLAEGPGAPDGFADVLAEIAVDDTTLGSPVLIQTIALAPTPLTPPTPDLVPFAGNLVHFGDSLGDRLGIVDLAAATFSVLGAPNITDPSSAPARDNSNNLIVSAPAPTFGLHIFEVVTPPVLTTSSLPGIVAGEISRTRTWDTTSRKFIVGVPTPSGSTGIGSIFRVTVPP